MLGLDRAKSKEGKTKLVYNLLYPGKYIFPNASEQIQ